tara:strand:+ start:2068 stop:2661 length:594 start_codon:yes stop_codon:yes gene_type:complete
MKELYPDKLFFKKHLIILVIGSVLLFALAVPFFQIIISDKEGIETSKFAFNIFIYVYVAFVFSYLLLAKIWIQNLKYIVKDNSITLFKGILTKTESNILYEKVTDFKLHRGLIDRLLGIGSVQIQTAGQSSTAGQYEGVLSGLLDYKNIHECLSKQIMKGHDNQNIQNQDNNKLDSSNAVLNDILKELKDINNNLNN